MLGKKASSNASEVSARWGVGANGGVPAQDRHCVVSVSALPRGRGATRSRASKDFGPRIAGEYLFGCVLGRGGTAIGIQRTHQRSVCSDAWPPRRAGIRPSGPTGQSNGLTANTSERPCRTETAHTGAVLHFESSDRGTHSGSLSG